MREQHPYVVYGFESTHGALLGERTLIAAEVPHTTIPTPKSLGTLCGLALRVPWEAGADADVALIKASMTWTVRIEMLDY